MVNFINDLKNYLQSGFVEHDISVSIRDYIPDGQPVDDSVSVSVASMKTEREYENFDGGKAAVTEVEFTTVTVGQDGGKTAATRNEDCVTAMKEMFEQDKVCGEISSVLRTDITDYECPHPISDTDQRYMSVIRIQFTVLMP